MRSQEIKEKPSEIESVYNGEYNGGYGGVSMIREGIYQHYKGNKYRVLFIAKHSETEEAMVVYQCLYGDYEYWVRPLSMFEEEVELAGEKVKRFKYISGF